MGGRPRVMLKVLGLVALAALTFNLLLGTLPVATPAASLASLPISPALPDDGWPAMTSSPTPNLVGNCTELLQRHGLCDPELLRAPAPRLVYTNDKPFVFLHFSKCAGTSLIEPLSYMGYIDFSLKLPRELSTAARCKAGVGLKCCWWRERLRNMSALDQKVKILTQEPANTARWVSLDDGAPRQVHAVDPGFDGARDFCAQDFAYLTVLRSPVERVRSHLCEIGVSLETWQAPERGIRGEVKRQLRDNYYVRSLGGPAAWEAPEGGVTRGHLLAAARTLARFDVVMTVATLSRDAPAQMGRVGLPGYSLKHLFARSRAENLERAKSKFGSWLRTAGKPSCEVPPTRAQLDRLDKACALDAVLYEFARILAARRTVAYST